MPVKLTHKTTGEVQLFATEPMADTYADRHGGRDAWTFEEHRDPAWRLPAELLPNMPRKIGRSRRRTHG